VREPERGDERGREDGGRADVQRGPADRDQRRAAQRPDAAAEVDADAERRERALHALRPREVGDQRALCRAAERLEEAEAGQDREGTRAADRQQQDGRDDHLSRGSGDDHRPAPDPVGEPAARDRPDDARCGRAGERETDAAGRHVQLVDRPDREEGQEREDAAEAERHRGQQGPKLLLDLVAEEPSHGNERALAQCMTAMTDWCRCHTIRACSRASRVSGCCTRSEPAGRCPQRRAPCT
jgi:hypothetical protein